MEHYARTHDFRQTKNVLRLMSQSKPRAKPDVVSYGYLIRYACLFFLGIQFVFCLRYSCSPFRNFFLFPFISFSLTHPHLTPHLSYPLHQVTPPPFPIPHSLFPPLLILSLSLPPPYPLPKHSFSPTSVPIPFPPLLPPSSCFAESKKPRSALTVFHQMRKRRIAPNGYTYMGVLKALSHMRDGLSAVQVSMSYVTLLHFCYCLFL